MITKLDVKTAGRTLDVFETFQDVKKPLSLSELAEFIGAPLSSCHGLVRTLRNRGYLYSVGSRNALYPTKKLLDVAGVIAANDPILEQLAPILAALRDETQETVILGKRQHDHIVYLDVFEGLHTIRYVARPGKLTALHSSAIGKAMLGRIAPERLPAFLASLEMPAITGRTLTNADELEKEIVRGRDRNYFVTSGESVEDVMAVATTIYAGSEWIGIAIAGPLWRMHMNFDTYVDALMGARGRIEPQEDSA